MALRPEDLPRVVDRRCRPIDAHSREFIHGALACVLVTRGGVALCNYRFATLEVDYEAGALFVDCVSHYRLGPSELAGSLCFEFSHSEPFCDVRGFEMSFGPERLAHQYCTPVRALARPTMPGAPRKRVCLGLQ